MMVEQLPLFPTEEIAQPAEAAPVADANAPLTAHTSLAAAMHPFRDFMQQQGFTQHTIASFLGDMRLVMRRLGRGTALGTVTTKQLQDFLTWLSHGRGVPCSPKSYTRRVTTLKVFFGWLKEVGVLPADPSAPIPQQRADSPLPQILYAAQIEELLTTTRNLMFADKPDARPHLLVSLLLATGIKKQECMGIKLSHIDLSDAAAPAVYIRYDSARYRLKERKLRLPDDFAATLARYQEQYHPRVYLFECTARNLEYVLTDLAKRIGLPEGLSFEMLRWTCAVRDYQGRMDEDLLRQKLGLSPITWQQTGEKLHRLARAPL